MNICEFCKTSFYNKSNLTKHQKISKSCILIQNVLKNQLNQQIKIQKEVENKPKKIFQCEYCTKILSSKQMLHGHLDICKMKKNPVENEEHKFNKINLEMNMIKEEIQKLKNNKSSNIIKEKVEKVEVITDIDIKEYKFGTTDFMVPIRSDGMINATALCKAGEKRIDHYKESPQTKLFLEELSLVTGIRVPNLFEANIGGQSGTWVHRKVGYHLAQWISPKFAVQVSTILDELFIIGKVDLSKDVPKDEIELQYKEKINSLTEEYKTLLHKHNSSLKTHRYVKFKKSDPCFYIIDSGIKCDCNNYYKFGIAGTDEKNTIDERLQSHRTLWPLLKVRFLLFIKDVSVIEKNFKMMYDKEINPNGHEIIEGVTLEIMTNRLKKLLDLLSITEYEIMIEEKLQEYNDYVDTTLKVK